jgi:hypothetical protein
VKSKVGKNPIVRKQPPLQLTKLIRVRNSRTTSSVLCLFGPRPLSPLLPCLLPSHEPDSFLTELFSVGCKPGIWLISYFQIPENPSFFGKRILHGVARWGWAIVSQSDTQG